MPVYPEELFLKAVDEVVKANADVIPPYGDGSSFYLRPFMIGTDPVLGVKPASEYEFRVFGSPVGRYFSRMLRLRICDLDRVAPHGTGHVKAGLNYAMSLYAITEAHALGYDENLYLDAATRTYVEEEEEPISSSLRKRENWSLPIPQLSFLRSQEIPCLQSQQSIWGSRPKKGP